MTDVSPQRTPSVSFDLTDKVAVVTGGSRGIGRAIAEGLSVAGAKVVVASRKLEACERAAVEIQSTTGNEAHAIDCHVGYWDQCERLVEETYSRLGRCDILVNNAGMSPPFDDLASVSEAYYDKVMAVNLKGPFRLSALFGQRMAEGDGGSIINVSTIGSLRPGANELVYSCAKAGLNALTIGLAEEYGPRVRSNAILPGAVDTDIAKTWAQETRERAQKTVPLRRMGQPTDFVGAAVWLASEASSWTTGSLIRIDGGAYRQMS